MYVTARGPATYNASHIHLKDISAAHVAGIKQRLHVDSMQACDGGCARPLSWLALLLSRIQRFRV